MTVFCQRFHKPTNPRMRGCERCGKVEMAHPPAPMRDQYYESAFLSRVADESGFDPGRLEQLIKDKLDWGDREFGPNGFLRGGFKGVEEAIDEQIDTIAWLLLELERRNALNEESEGVYHHAYRACVGAAMVLHELYAARAHAREDARRR